MQELPKGTRAEIRIGPKEAELGIVNKEPQGHKTTLRTHEYKERHIVCRLSVHINQHHKSRVHQSLLLLLVAVASPTIEQSLKQWTLVTEGR
jgi:hypothetical protein